MQGGGIGTIGLVAAGLKPLWSVECNPDIADVHRLNHHHEIIVEHVENTDPTKLPRVDFLCASPVCTRASRANVGGEESDIDIIAAKAVCRYIDVMRPANVLIENVWQYRHFDSFKLILAMLEKYGYFYSYDYLCSADFGVPQTRWRLILRACHSRLVPSLPTPTKWIGWYEAIEDLLPELQDTKFADWQMAMMPEELKTLLCGVNGENRELFRGVDIPASVVTASSLGRQRAVLVDPNNATRNFTCREQGEPSVTVVSSCMRRPGNTAMALLISSTSDVSIREGDLPAGTVLANDHQGGDKGATRALLFSDRLSSGGTELAISIGDVPAACVTANSDAHPNRAFLLDGQPNGNNTSVTIREGDEPMFTIQSSADRKPTRAFTGYRIVRLSARCLARFQTIPDNYILPTSNKLAATIIGNGVPCELQRRIVESML